MQEGEHRGSIGAKTTTSESETRLEERALFCSISFGDIEQEHVATSNGQAYERLEIERWLGSSIKDPNTNLELAIHHLIRIGEAERTCLSAEAIRALVSSFWLKFEFTRCYMLDRGTISCMPSGKFVRRSVTGRFFHQKNLDIPKRVCLTGCVFRDCSFSRVSMVEFRECRFEGNNTFSLLQDSYFVDCCYGELCESSLLAVAICERALVSGHTIFESAGETCIRSPKMVLGKNGLFMIQKLRLAAELLLADDEYSLVLRRPTARFFLRSLLSERHPEKTYLYALFCEGFGPGELFGLEEREREVVKAFAEAILVMGDKHTRKCASVILGGSLSHSRVL